MFIFYILLNRRKKRKMSKQSKKEQKVSMNLNMMSQEHQTIKKIEIAEAKQQIEIIATFLPDIILDLNQNHLESRENYLAVVLLGSLNGLNTLVEKHNKLGLGGIYRLCSTINAFLGTLIELICVYGGDVLKFSGDFILAQWKILPNQSLFNSIHGAVTCSLLIQERLGKFKTEENIPITIKIAISCANLTFAILGNSRKKSFALASEGLADLNACLNDCSEGAVGLTPIAWAHMLQERYEIVKETKNLIRVIKIGYKPSEGKKRKDFIVKLNEGVRIIHIHRDYMNLIHSHSKFESNMNESKHRSAFLDSLSKRSSIKTAVRQYSLSDIRTFIFRPIKTQIDDRQPLEYLTEMRDMTIQLFNIQPFVPYGIAILDLASEVYNTIWKILNTMAYIQYINLFNGTIKIAVIFGLNKTIDDMECMLALKMSHRIRFELLQLENIKSVTVSVTKGFLLCGVLGHPYRQDYLTVGYGAMRPDSLLRMYKDCVICDYKSYKQSKLASYYFSFANSGKITESEKDIFEFSEPFQSSSGFVKAPSKIVGRHEVLEMVRAILNQEIDNYVGICIYGRLNLGKSCLIRSLIDSCRKVNERIISIELESSNYIPYFCSIKLYKQLYNIAAEMDTNTLESIKNLPRILWDIQECRFDTDEDIAWKKYRTLNYFRDIITVFIEPVYIFIDNAEFIDIQSWEILEISLRDKNIRLIMAANFEETSWDLKFKISINDQIKLYELKGIDDFYIPLLACEYLDVDGIPKDLAKLLVLTCQGQPDYLQDSLLRLLNNKSLEINKITTASPNYIFPYKRSKIRKNVYLVLDFTENYKKRNENITVFKALTWLEIFLPFERLVIKTASTLGDIFSRNLLVAALKFPSDSQLSKTIKVLFEKNIFDCGSRYVNPDKIETNKLCCKCYFSASLEASKDDLGLPRYAYCRSIHFCNKYIQEIAYKNLPANQRKELHKLSTEFLETSNNLCPSCRRNPSQAFMVMDKFKDVVSQFGVAKRPNNIIKKNYIDHDDLKQFIRKSVFTGTIDDEVVDIRKIECDCVEIQLRLYRNLITHSKKADDVLRNIFYTTQCGLLLILLRDIVNGSTFLNNARELCLVNATLPNCLISESFRRVHVGKIEMGLAKGCMVLFNINEAQIHLAIALRQYNIPSLTLGYKHLSKLLTREFVKIKHNFLTFYRNNNILRNDLGSCLILCSKLFLSKCQWKMAKFCSIYSVYILKGVNINTSLLFQSYSTALDICKHCSDISTCIELQKFVEKQMNLNFSNNLTYNIEAFGALLENFIDIKSMNGEIASAIRLGYRVLDMHNKINSKFINLSTIDCLIQLLMFAFRIFDAVNILLQLSHNNYSKVTGQNPTLNFQMSNLLLYINTGFHFEPIDNTLKYAENYFDSKSENSYNWNDYNFLALLTLHFMRLDQYENAKKWYRDVTIDKDNIKNKYVITSLCVYLEIKILKLIRSKHEDHHSYAEDNNFIKRWFELLKGEVEKSYVLFRPFYYIYYAWYCRLNKKTRKSEELLKKAIQEAEKQGNHLHKCNAIRQLSAWNGGNAFKYNQRPVVWYHFAGGFSETDLAQLLHPLPI